MKGETAVPMVRRVLFDGELMQVAHVVARPVSAECGEVEASDMNALALPLAGVFTKHDGPRRHAVATPNHAVFISAGRPYRIGFPGRIGDRCLVLRFSSAALARVMPEAMARDGLDTTVLASRALLPPAAMLARSQLWARLQRGDVDALAVEELGIGLLDAALGVARSRHDVGSAAAPADPGRRWRQVERVKEAIAIDPERKWTLGDLADVACVTPCHLARVFRAEVGTSVYRYVVRSRLARALDAVLESNTDLTAIALDAGFASHSHFTARFRALFGHTPVDLRRGLLGVRGSDLHKIVTAQEMATT
jgi:AraC family transcriptional regulator